MKIYMITVLALISCLPQAFAGSMDSPLAKFTVNTGTYHLDSYSDPNICQLANSSITVDVQPDQNSVTIQASSNPNSPAIDETLVVGSKTPYPHLWTGSEFVEVQVDGNRVVDKYFIDYTLWQKTDHVDTDIVFLSDKQVQIPYETLPCVYSKD